MNKASKNIEPREGARPVCVRQKRPEGRGRTDAQERVKRCLAGVWESCAAGSQTPRDRKTEVRTKQSQP